MRARRLLYARLEILVASTAILLGLGLAPPDDAEERVEERVVVTATRLVLEPGPRDEVPAHVTVIEADQIGRTVASTLQDLLALEAGIVLYDQVGNDIEKTLDLRGFARGTGTRVYLDGAPINDTRSNALALDLVPLGALERIEITRGSVGAVAGSGAEAGVIHLMTRRGEGFGGSLELAGGSFDTSHGAAALSGEIGPVDVHVSGRRDETDGFRQNAGGDQRWLTATVGRNLGTERRLDLAVVSSRSDLGNPGALTEQELEADPFAAPYNEVDFSNQELTQASLNFRGTIGGGLSIAANVFGRSRESEILSTGRSKSSFGGFFLDSEALAIGSTLELGQSHHSGPRTNRWTAGLEWLHGATDARSFFTPPSDLTQVDFANPASENTAGRSTIAVFAQDEWRPRRDLSLVGSVRADRDRVDYEDALDPSLDDARTFSEISLRAGASWNPTERHGVWASYGEGFLPPTVEQLFSFPGFFSNPDLRPEDSRSYEIGFRGRWPREMHLDVALFRIDTADEIVFVVSDPSAGTGINDNVGATRREGVEIAFGGRAHARLRVFVNLTLTDATFREGEDEGREIPLVPRERLAAGFDLDLAGRIALRAQAIYVGEQVLDNDPQNARSPLDRYTVADARLAWSAVDQAGGRGLRLYVEARNLFDADYASRGIWAGQPFFTPAPGRRWLSGVNWTF